MVDLQINVQQLPLSILEELIETLDVDEKLALVNSNKYFNSIASPILYKDILMDYEFDEIDEAFQSDSETEEQEKDTSKKQSLVNLWKKLQPSIVKFNKYILKSQIFNSENLGQELSAYSNLKTLKIKLESDEAVQQFIDFSGPTLGQLNRLQLKTGSGLDYEVEDLIPHFQNIKELELELWKFNTGWLSQFKSDNLIYLKVVDWSCQFTFFETVKENFKNLRALDFEFLHCTFDSEDVVVPVMENIVDLKFTALKAIDPPFLKYLIDGKNWPNLKNLDAYVISTKSETLTNQFPNLVSLYTNLFDPANLSHFDLLSKLQVLNLDVDSRCTDELLPTLFENLSGLKDLTLRGTLSSKHFNFQPKLPILKFSVYTLSDFTESLVKFIKDLTLCRSLDLDFNGNAFENVDLDSLLKTKHIFSDLRSLELRMAPVALEKWFVGCSTTLSKVVTVNHDGCNVMYS